jgi:hypothetical protein
MWTDGRKNRVIQAQGILQSALENNVEPKIFGDVEDLGTNRNFVVGGDWVYVLGRVDAGDEVWFLHESCVPLLFRRRGRYHELSGTVRYCGLSKLSTTQRNVQIIVCMDKYHEERVRDLLEDVHRRFDKSPSELQTISIC